MPRSSVRTKRPTAFEQQIAPLSCTPLDSSSDVTEPPRRAAPDLTHRCANLNQRSVLEWCCFAAPSQRKRQRHMDGPEQIPVER
jgi:hypothetical protein